MGVPARQTLSVEDPRLALHPARRKGTAPVLIVGAGIGGLAAAIAMAQRGIASHILERRSDFNEEGAGIQIGPNGTKILVKLGVADVLRARVGVPECIRVRDGVSGEELAVLPLGRWIAERHGAPYWVAHRKDLQSALLERARAQPLVRISTGVKLGEVAEFRSSVMAGEDSRSWEGSALIGADGIWSDIRSACFDARRPSFVGKSAIRTVVSAISLPAALRVPEIGLWIGRAAHIVHYPVRAGREIAVVAILDDQEATEDWSAPVAADWVASRVPRFQHTVRQLFAAAADWRKWTLHRLPPLRRWAAGRVALLGDAAHPVLPFLAQGAVLALEDAVVLADALARFDNDRVKSLRWYERQRIGRAARVAAASRRNGQIFRATGALAVARNLALRNFAPERLMARYDWVYGWRSETEPPPLPSSQ